MHQDYKQQWSNIDGMPDPTAYVTIMAEMRDTQPDEDFAPLVSRLDLQPDLEILEVCCGEGRIAQFVAQSIGTGQVTGVDNSAAMINAAKSKPDIANLPIRFIQADAHQLPFPDHSFDRVYSMFSLQIVPEPEGVLAEMVRVLRPGGRLFHIDHDNRGWMIDSDMPSVTTKIVAYFGEHVTNGAFIFSIPRRLKDMGFAQVQVEGYVDLSYDVEFASDPYFNYEHTRLLFLAPLVQDALNAGIIDQQEAEQWLAEQDQRAREGRFYMASPSYRVIAVKQAH